MNGDKLIDPSHARHLSPGPQASMAEGRAARAGNDGERAFQTRRGARVGPIIEPADPELHAEFGLKFSNRRIEKAAAHPRGRLLRQALSLRISSASTHSARFRLTLRSMLQTARVCMRRPCALRPS